MGEVTTVGLDIAKSVFQVHGIGSGGEILVQRKLTRSRLLPFFQKLPRCLVGIEACATAHQWARELKALGHEVRLMPPSYVKPYVKRQKNDMADAPCQRRAVHTWRKMGLSRTEWSQAAGRVATDARSFLVGGWLAGIGVRDTHTSKRANAPRLR
jgi:transposase